jgi:flagellar hook-basal body complex protein FliE
VPIAPIPPISTLSPIAAPTAAAPSASTGIGATDPSFSSAITNAVDSLQQAQTAASSAEALSAAGQGNLADTMIAASKASLDTQVTTSLLNKAVTSYNEIMNMSF